MSRCGGGAVARRPNTKPERRLTCNASWTSGEVGRARPAAIPPFAHGLLSEHLGGSSSAVAEKAGLGTPAAEWIHRGISAVFQIKRPTGSYSRPLPKVSVSDAGKLKGASRGDGGHCEPSGQSRPDRGPGPGFGGLLGLTAAPLGECPAMRPMHRSNSTPTNPAPGRMPKIETIIRPRPTISGAGSANRPLSVVSPRFSNADSCPPTGQPVRSLPAENISLGVAFLS